MESVGKNKTLDEVYGTLTSQTPEKAPIIPMNQGVDGAIVSAVV
jgi:hypothetical protein